MINLKDIKSYSDEKQNGIKSAIETILANMENSDGLSSNSTGKEKWDDRLKQPDLPNKQTKDFNKDNQKDDSQKEKNNQPLNQKKIEQIRKLVQELRNAADDVIDDNDDEIQKTDKIEKVSDAADKLNSDIVKDSNPEKNFDKYKKRLQKIADFWDDDTVQELDKELHSNKVTQQTRRKLRDDLKKALDNKKQFRNFKTVNIDVIKNDIVKTLKKEYTNNRNSDYQHYSYKSQTFGRPVPGRYMDNKGKTIPIVALFFDNSGSWSGNKEKYLMEQKLTASILELDRKGVIKLQVYFFANTTSTDKESVGTGNSDAPVPYIKELLQAKKIDNAIIMTDSDPSTDISLTLPGYLWLLFYDNITESFVQNLKGRKGTSVYMIQHD